jgi:hypothetical protein
MEGRKKGRLEELAAELAVRASRSAARRSLRRRKVDKAAVAALLNRSCRPPPRRDKVASFLHG